MRRLDILLYPEYSEDQSLLTEKSFLGHKVGLLLVSSSVEGFTSPQVMLYIVLVIIAGALGTVLWKRRISKERLPPGSFGWPLIGETFPFVNNVSISKKLILFLTHFSIAHAWSGSCC